MKSPPTQIERLFDIMWKRRSPPHVADFLTQCVYDLPWKDANLRKTHKSQPAANRVHDCVKGVGWWGAQRPFSHCNALWFTIYEGGLQSFEACLTQLTGVLRPSCVSSQSMLPSLECSLLFGRWPSLHQRMCFKPWQYPRKSLGRW